VRLLAILLVEDNQVHVWVVREALRTHQIEHELFVATDGEQAIEFVGRMGRHASTPYPDMVLLDLNLPKADGAEVLRELRQHPVGARTLAIVVTSSDSAKDRARVAALGISRYFLKPTDFAEFLHLGRW
jgi:CheY-like chemotaxis protein